MPCVLRAILGPHGWTSFSSSSLCPSCSDLASGICLKFLMAQDSPAVPAWCTAESLLHTDRQGKSQRQMCWKSCCSHPHTGFKQQINEGGRPGAPGKSRSPWEEQYPFGGSWRRSPWGCPCPAVCPGAKEGPLRGQQWSHC